MDEMNITSAKYVTDPIEPSNGNAGVIAIIDGQTVHIPMDVDNRHYAAVLLWASKDGNTIQDAD